MMRKFTCPYLKRKKVYISLNHQCFQDHDIEETCASNRSHQSAIRHRNEIENNHTELEMIDVITSKSLDNDDGTSNEYTKPYDVPYYITILPDTQTIGVRA